MLINEPYCKVLPMNLLIIYFIYVMIYWSEFSLFTESLQLISLLEINATQFYVFALR